MAAPHSAVHQINFGLQPEGVTVVGGTLSDEDMLFWLRRLQVHLRMQRFGSALPPDRALSTFEFADGWTAVVRRWSSGGTLGRNDSMAIIARSAWLPLPVVLGLDQRFDWETAAKQRPFQKWDAEQLQALGDEGARDLRAPAQQLPDLLRRTLGRLFDAPEQPLTIVGCPEKQRIPLLWGVHKLAAPRLLQQYGRRLSTFSTYEVEDADSIAHLPAIVFLPDRPVGATVSRRTLVDVRVDANVSTASADLARRRVELFLADREDQPEFDTSPAAPAREAALVGREPARAGGPTASAGAREAGENGWIDAEASPRPGDDPRRTRPGDDGVRPELAAAVARLRQAVGMTSLKAGMSDLALLTATPDDRAALRGWLGPGGYAQLAVDVATNVVQPDNHRAYFRHLQQIAFAPDRSDLGDGQASRFAADVIQSRTSPDLGAVVFADLTKVHGEEVVLHNLAYRWLEDHGLSADVLREADGPPPEATSVAPLTPRPGDAEKPRRWWHFLWPQHTQPQDWQAGRAQAAAAKPGPLSRSSWAFPIGAAAVAIVVLGVLAFVALFPAAPETTGAPGDAGSTATSAGGAPASTTSTTAAPATPTTSVATTPQAAAPTPQVSGTVGGRDLQVVLPKSATESSVVYLLLHPRSGGAYYYRGQCALDETQAAWACKEQPVLPAVPADDQGYDVVLVTKLGDQTQDNKKRFVVPEPEQAAYVVSPIRSP